MQEQAPNCTAPTGQWRWKSRIIKRGGWARIQQWRRAEVSSLPPIKTNIRCKYLPTLLLSVPLLLLNPAALAAETPVSPESEERTIEDAEEEKLKAAEDASREAGEEKAPQQTDPAKQAAEKAEAAEKNATDPAERATPPRSNGTRREAEIPERTAPRRKPADPSDPSDPSEPSEPKAQRPARPERADKEKPDRPARPERADKEKPDRPAVPETAKAEEIAPAPKTEPERKAETEVREATQAVQREIGQRATKIRDREEAKTLIDEIIGAESRISRAEIAREERVRPRLEAAERRRGDKRAPEASPKQRQDAVRYFQQRLRGEAVDAPPPELLRLSDSRRSRPEVRREVIEKRVEVQRPRYLREGRRYVHFDSRASIPAILLAAQAMNYVQFQSAREVAPMFYQDVSAPQSVPLPPANFRNESALVVSYPVDEKSMITSDDILFQQGSTQFADPFSYEIVATLADAMKDLPAKERFVVEGHASAEGSYESNMALSQQRAERIVREMVRRGVSPQRLLPVGYGESEARHPDNSAEALRSQDRRVVVFRLRDEPLASR